MDTGKRLDLGTDPQADIAAQQIARSLPCAGGCGRPWDDVAGGYMSFMALEDGTQTTDPRWHCVECNEAHVEALFARTAQGKGVH